MSDPWGQPNDGGTPPRPGLPDLRGGGYNTPNAGMGGSGGSQPPSSGENPPVCPRHPNRISYVRCQRCNRPVCPDCQRPAAVGVQCVDCVREQQKTTRKVRTQFGAPVRQGPPIVTYTLIGICVVAYLLQMMIPSFESRFLFSPLSGRVEPYRFITAAFLHGSVMHIALNMLSLWIVGRILEPALGRLRFLTLYLVCAVGGSVGVLVAAMGDPVTSSSWHLMVLGASGAIFGLFGAFFLAVRATRGDMGEILGLIVLNLVFGFVVPGIAWQAHLGGLVTGLLLGAAYIYAPRSKSKLIYASATVGVIVILVGLSLWKYASVGLL